MNGSAATSAAGYTHGHHESVLRSHRWRTARNSAGYLLPWLKQSDRLLDVGCGPGTLTVDLARRLPWGSAIGIDASCDVVQSASELATRTGANNVTFAVADARSLSACPAVSSLRRPTVVHAHQVLQHVADPVAMLKEMMRVVVPGGLVAVRDADYSAMSWWPRSPALQHWSDLYRRVARADGGEPDAGRRLLGWACAAGLELVEVSTDRWVFSTPQERDWWAEGWATRITESRVATRAVELGLASRAELATVAAGWRDWAHRPDAWFAVAHGQILGRSPRTGSATGIW